jgi:hypothetical protein
LSEEPARFPKTQQPLLEHILRLQKSAGL